MRPALLALLLAVAPLGPVAADDSPVMVTVADPFQPNPVAPSASYDVGIDRVVCSILLGVITYDANMLVIRPRRRKA